MTLKAYQKKRNFNKTPEPLGKINPSGKQLPRFVIQKHHASRLHYDLRLEADGVLISWAVPKGPSQKTTDKRLAMMVEDHPLDYYHFEGIIPKGNYGAGTVMIWDWGNYVLKDETDPKIISQAVRNGLEKGKLHVVFNGNKIKGEFALVKTSKDKDEWLFFKIKDNYTSDEPYENEEISVKSKRSFSEIKNTAAANDEIWLSPPDLSEINFDGLEMKSMPKWVNPMLASSVELPFDNKDWVFEIKWDGYRCISELRNGTVEMYSRNLKSFNKKFQIIYNSLKKVPFNAIFDGEIVIVDEKGKSDFNLLQNYRNSDKNLVYYVFDLLYLDKFDLTSLPLYKRKEILEDVLPNLTNIRYSDHIPQTGKAFFEMAVNMDLEGIIGKKKNSKYLAGTRTNDWVKIKTQKRIEAVICGFTKPRGGRKYFGALILGIYDDDQLKYIGHSGGGFSNSDLKSLHEILIKSETDKSPFKSKPVTNMPVTWLKPQLVCEIKYLEWTNDNVLRNPIFLGLREDKTPNDLKSDGKQDIPEIVEKKNTVSKIKKSTVSEFFDIDELLVSKKDEGILVVNKIKLKITNLNKIFWPELKYTKGDLIKYYWEISEYILPHLKDRPESLNRFPNGIYGKSFYQKDMKDLPPEWIETKKIKSDSGNKSLNYLLCQDKATLIYLANLGCIELNPWSSRISNLDHPDYTIIDLDPPENMSFDMVTEVALIVKEVIDEAGLSAFVKTSGSSGLHILIPLKGKYNYEQGRQFALLIGNLVHQRTKSITSLERLTKKRGNKIYIDCLQNYAGQTIASAYCARPRMEATVSTPLEWEELDKDLSPSNFTIKNLIKRLNKKGDLLQNLYSKSNDLSKALTKLEKQIKI
jgi:bifunctional non-homologous end joining protein LigD